MMDVIQKPAAAGYDAPPYLRRSGGGGRGINERTKGEVCGGPGGRRIQHQAGGDMKGSAKKNRERKNERKVD